MAGPRLSCANSMGKLPQKRFKPAPHLPARMDFTLAYSARPCAVLPPTGQKPLTFSSFRAFLVASHHRFKALVANAFFDVAERPLLTTLPALFLTKLLLVKPPTVFSLCPLKTRALASLPLPILLTFITFFMAFFFMA